MSQIEYIVQDFCEFQAIQNIVVNVNPNEMKYLPKYRLRLGSLILPVLSLLFLSCNSDVGKSGKSELSGEAPNIILILADDMGYSDLGCYGGEISTPYLDQLASEGVRFTQFYNAARCCPTRASLLTGLYPHQSGMGGMINDPATTPEGPYQGYLSKHAVTIAEVLKQANYYTASSGKWHVGEERPHWPMDRGFDNYYGLISGAANYFDITRTKKEGIKRHFAIDSVEYMPPNEGFYMTDAITENAIKFLKTAHRKDQSFFLYLAYTAPHWPLHAKQEDIDKYLGTYMAGWDVLRKERYNRMIQMGLIDESWGLSERDAQASPWETLDEEQKVRMDLLMSIYAAQVDCMDRGIGEVMAQLEAMDEKDNTIVMFLSDNGGSEETGPFGQDFWGNFWDGDARPGSGDSYHSYGGSWANLSNTPFRYYKKRTHEGGVATPFIVSWPDQVKQVGELIHEPGHIIDIMATICEAANVEYPVSYHNNDIIPLPGRSLLPVLQRKEMEREDPIFWEHNGNRAIRKGDWKLVTRKGDEWELFNLATDRSETNNLVEIETEKAAHLLKLYEVWADEVGVK
jgi:arylsulfatase A-like enzyme